MPIYLDEDLSQHKLVWALRSRGFDVLTSLDAGMNGQGDDSQLTFAASQGRVLVTGNARDFALLHRDWLRQGRRHAGIVLIRQQRYSTGDIVRRLLRLTSSHADETSGLYYLSNF